jgi:RNA polymerase sigma factor (sigma-70 family)
MPTNEPDPSDSDLMLKMACGDESALEELISRYGGRVRAFVRQKYEVSIGSEGVDAVVNGAFMKAWKCAEAYDESKGTVRSWLLRIAQSEAIDLVNDKPEYKLELDGQEPEYDPAAQADNDVSPVQAELLRMFDKAVQSLPRMQRRIIEADLAAGERADDDWLARELGTTVNSVRVSRVKALASIKTHLEKEPTAKAALGK